MHHGPRCSGVRHLSEVWQHHRTSSAPQDLHLDLPAPVKYVDLTFGDVLLELRAVARPGHLDQGARPISFT